MVKLSSLLQNSPQFYYSRIVMNIIYLEVLGYNFW